MRKFDRPLSPTITACLGNSRPYLEKPPEGHVRILCVGDVHGQWSEIDEDAIIALSPDVVLFVGDYGNEDVTIVRRIANFSEKTDAACAAVLGNHDGFYTMSHIGRKRCPYDSLQFDRVREQLDLLAPINPGYRSLVVNTSVPFSIVGGRPLSWGGPHWKHANFYRQYFQVGGMSDSAERITSAAVNASHNSIIFLAHSGPTGLGDKPSDPCGRDWGSTPGGDYGDADLRQSIDAARARGKVVPLVVFGHMHSILSNGLGFRTMLTCETDAETGKVTVMLDAAVVPRHKRGRGRQDIICQFSVVELGSNLSVQSVEQIWVSRIGEIVESNVLYDGRATAAAL